MNSKNKVCVGLSLHFQTCSFVFKTMDLVERTTCVKIHKKQTVFAQVWQKVHLLKLKQKLLKSYTLPQSFTRFIFGWLYRCDMIRWQNTVTSWDDESFQTCLNADSNPSVLFLNVCAPKREQKRREMGTKQLGYEQRKLADHK